MASYRIFMIRLKLICHGERYLLAKAMEDPFAYLRSSFAFKPLGYKSELVPITEILQSIESKLAESKVQSK